MKINKIVAAYFSPTENAKKIATFMALYVQKCLSKHLCATKTGFAGDLNQAEMEDVISIEYVDFTLPSQRLVVREFTSKELVLFVVPVYAGRVPNKVLPFVQNLFKGRHTPVVPIVTYGNRNYDNALKELCMELDKNGFLAIGAAAIVGEHAFSDQLAKGRPNEADMKELKTFADAIAQKFIIDMKTTGKTVNSMRKEYDICPVNQQQMYLNLDEIPGDWPLENYYTPLGMDGKPAAFLKAKPKTNGQLCDQCGVCANTCPMGSISRTDCSTVEGICIKCQACIKTCPEGAKYFDDEAFLSHVKMLETHYGKENKNSVYFL